MMKNQGTAFELFWSIKVQSIRVRQDGSLVGVSSSEEYKTNEELLEMSQSRVILSVDLISGVSCKAPYDYVYKTGSRWD